MDSAEALAAALRAAEILIAYTPIGDEPRYEDFFKAQNINARVILVPPKREAPPQDAAKEFSGAHAGEKVCLLIPGREFDRSGTRHGRGGGWYDRFLSAVPREWLRIGVLNAEQLSGTKLKRESWDEPMDMLLVKKAPEWEVIPVETLGKRR